MRRPRCRPGRASPARPRSGGGPPRRPTRVRSRSSRTPLPAGGPAPARRSRRTGPLRIGRRGRRESRFIGASSCRVRRHGRSPLPGSASDQRPISNAHLDRRRQGPAGLRWLRAPAPPGSRRRGPGPRPAGDRPVVRRRLAARRGRGRRSDGAEPGDRCAADASAGDPAPVPARGPHDGVRRARHPLGRQRSAGDLHRTRGERRGRLLRGRVRLAQAGRRRAAGDRAVRCAGRGQRKRRRRRSRVHPRPGPVRSGLGDRTRGRAPATPARGPSTSAASTRLARRSPASGNG